MSRVAKPRATLQHAHARSNQKTHLLGQLLRLLAAVVEVLCEFPIEEENRFAYRHPVLRTAEAKHVDSALPGKFRGGAAKTGASIGEARSIHVQPQTVFPALLRESAQLLDGVDAACFRGLADGDGARLRVMNVSSAASDHLHRGRSEFAVVAFGDKKLGTVGKELRSAAFVRLHVGGLTADDSVVRLAEGSQYQ